MTHREDGESVEASARGDEVQRRSNCACNLAGESRGSAPNRLAVSGAVLLSPPRGAPWITLPNYRRRPSVLHWRRFPSRTLFVVLLNVGASLYTPSGPSSPAWTIIVSSLQRPTTQPRWKINSFPSLIHRRRLERHFFIGSIRGFSIYKYTRYEINLMSLAIWIYTVL